MAEAFTNKLSAERGLPVGGHSAGTIAGEVINPIAVSVMAEAGIPMTGQCPKQLTQEMADSADRIITMGCGVDAGACPARIHITEDWSPTIRKDGPSKRAAKSAMKFERASKTCSLKCSPRIGGTGANPRIGGKGAGRGTRAQREVTLDKALLRRYFAEAIGRFCIVFAPVALSATGHATGGDGTLLAAALVSGLVVSAMIFTLGHISAAHFNPAVTIAFASAGRFPWRYVLPYCISQILGGVAAAGLSAVLFGAAFGAYVRAAGPIFRPIVL